MVVTTEEVGGGKIKWVIRVKCIVKGDWTLGGEHMIKIEMMYYKIAYLKLT